ncbi:Carboxylesterase [Boletus edulis BED1]|uniref:Carboxylesterase n=1 Tax=Boletus edulis BED1 TaxID=1328754 RepID=A0AAD4BXI3_BOLED|nr:Carboxylesterase [Boletus edulis BED1]
MATKLNENMKVPIVDLGYAQYQGHFDPQMNITSFLSIRYAASPLGNLRFQAPRPPVPESGMQPATQNPNMCYQAPFGANMKAPVPPYGYNKRESTIPSASEDCLFLNVFVPGAMPVEPGIAAGLPVLVWIHGGGYAWGYAATYNGADLLIDSLNTVVVVVIQYRLGAFDMSLLRMLTGFLAGNEVKAQGALNAGLLDQTLHYNGYKIISECLVVTKPVLRYGANPQVPAPFCSISSGSQGS